jgi:hypothetical protein
MKKFAFAQNDASRAKLGFDLGPAVSGAIMAATLRNVNRVLLRVDR